MQCSKGSLFNHLVDQLLQMQGHVEAERFRGLEVDHLLELGGRLNRQLAWLRAPEDAIDVDAARRYSSGILGP